MSADPHNAKSIFLNAAERPAGDAREAYLAEACGEDAPLRREVDELLAHFDRVGSFLETPEVVSTIDAQPPSETVGTLLAGKYKLLEEIGEGGMGTVWMAQQQEPVKRVVAIKLIKAGMDTKSVLARFEAERQALALMDHPNIAKVFDAGGTAFSIDDLRLPIEEKSTIANQKSTIGRPYFVMELVKGIPITKYCDEHHLTPRQRLELFIPVCQAIQHAHQKGIIHRDLKPSNVLVAQYDGRPVPKVIDFGVAKAAGQPLTEQTLVTGFGAIVGTLEYMSPEQAELNQLDIDTRSDIYSLGVLLYELLTGSTPLDHNRLKQSGLLEALRIIREGEVPTLSDRLRTTAELPMVAANRDTEPAKLAKLVRGELDWIVMKAMEKDRSRRYETANGFAMDVQHYLSDEQVLACPPSAGYKLRKFVRRNRRSLVMVTVVVSAAVLAAGSFGWAFRDRAARQAEADRETVAREARNDREGEIALQEAARLRDRRSWVEAREAAKAVERLLAAGAREDRRQQLRAIVADLDMVDRLEEIRLQPYISGWSLENRTAANQAYADAFRDYGIDVEGIDRDEADRRVRAAAIREDLICALDDWAWIRTAQASNPTLPAHPSPVQNPWSGFRNAIDHFSIFGPSIPSLGDKDEYRSLLRDRKVLKDQAALRALAERPETAGLRPSTALLLARALSLAKENDKALEVLYGAQQRYPNDVVLNLQLVMELRKSRPAEALGFARAALAARPEHPGVHARVGELLLATGRQRQAIAAFRKALELGHPHVAGAVEAEFLPVTETRHCQASLQDMSSWTSQTWSNGCQLFCRAQRGGYVELAVEVPRAGRHALTVHFTKAFDYGIVEVSLDGAKIGEPFDGYFYGYPFPGVIPSGGVAFGMMDLGQGQHQIRFTAVDKNAKSKDYFMGIDCLKLEPVN
jgi:serine/threonine protein kinase/tetratricopeptide (TPR) repeat protein